MENDARRARIAGTIEHIAARWADADTGLLRQVFPLLAEGRPVPVERIAERAGARSAAVDRALAAGRASRDAAGRVVELSGLTLHPTSHRVDMGNVTLFSCCGLLAHLTPLLLDRPVTLESIDPQTRRAIRLDLTPTRVTAVAPAEAVASFVVTRAGRMMTDVGGEFCGHVHHFADPATAETYASADPRRYVIAIGELRAAAEDLYRRVWSDGRGP
jgi:alkylmercury lyase